MSTKTMKQRIALVAVSALTAGLFSVVSTPVANATAGDTAADTLAIQIANSTTGAVVQTAGGGDTAADRSVGFIAVTTPTGTDQVAVGSTAMGIKAGTTGTAVMLASGKLQVSASNGSTQATDNLVISVSGGTVSGVNSESATAQPTLAYNSSASAASMALNANSNNSMSATITPNAGATTMTVSAYKGASATASSPTSGTLLGRWIVTLVTSSAASVFSAVDSPVAVTTSATATQITTSVDASTSGILAGNPLFIQVIGKNAYGQALASGTYVAQATNGATLAWGNAAAATAAGTLSVATATPDGTDQLRIDPASSLATSTTTVTITHDGLPVATKTLTFYGEAKRIVIESVKSGRTGTTVAGSDATAYAVYSYRDSAGDKVPGSAAAFAALSSTGIVTTGASVRSPSRSTQATLAGTTSALADAQETAIGAGADGIFAFSCGSTSGTSTVTIAHVNAISLATITTPVTVSCNGGIATYTVSADKASYAVGDVATFTIDAKDSSGNAVSDNTVIAAGSVSVGGGSLTVAIAGTEMFSAGKRTVQAQMTTAGTFNTVVALAGSTTTNATVKYAVGDGATSNADVLKAIVSLIASINKQIAALQKALLRR
jgi:hypothetical protein